MRAEILGKTGLDRAIERIEFAQDRAQEYGNTELVAKLEEVRLRLVANKENGDDDVSAEDEKVVDALIWWQHANHLSLKAEESLTTALRVDAEVTQSLDKIEGLRARLQEKASNSVLVRLGIIEDRLTSVESELSANIVVTQTALAAFKEDSSLANAKALHEAVIKMKVSAIHAGNGVRYWVSLFNLVERLGDKTVIDTVDKVVGRVKTVDDVRAEADVEARATIDASLYGTA